MLFKNKHIVNGIVYVQKTEYSKILTVCDYLMVLYETFLCFKFSVLTDFLALVCVLIRK